MEQERKNKKFIQAYYEALAGKQKTEPLIRQFVEDEKLVQHILFFDKTFPEYDAIQEEVIAEGDRVFVRLKIIGKHMGETNGIPPTLKDIEVPFAICYKIKDEKIVDHWMIADQLEMLEQLGLTREQIGVTK